MRGSGRSIALLAVLLVLLPIGVPGARAGSRLQKTRPVELGVLLNGSPTGDPDTQVAIRFAADDLNAFFAAVAAPFRVHLTVEGTGLDPDVARDKIARFAVLGLDVVVGPESSAEVAAVKPFTDAHHMVALSHCSTAPSLAIPGDSVYRMVPSDLYQAAAIARLIAGDGQRALVPLWRADVWGDDISAAAGQRFAALGGTVYPGVRFDPDAADVAGVLAALAAQVEQARRVHGDAVAVVFFGFGTDGSRLLAGAADIPLLGSVTWYGSDGTALSREILGDPRAAHFAVQTGFSNTLFADAETPRGRALRQRISAALDGGNVYFCAPAAYDAVGLAGLSAAAAGTADIEAFERTLVAFAGVYPGVSGPTAFDAAGDRAQAAYDVWIIQDDGGQFTWRKASRTVPPTD